MVSKNTKIIKYSLCLCVMILLVSCKTTPRAPDAFLEDGRFVPLLSGASVYILTDVKQLVVQQMENAVQLDVPLKVDVEIGVSWGA